MAHVSLEIFLFEHFSDQLENLVWLLFQTCRQYHLQHILCILVESVLPTLDIPITILHSNFKVYLKSPPQLHLQCRTPSITTASLATSFACHMRSTAQISARRRMSSNWPIFCSLASTTSCRLCLRHLYTKTITSPPTISATLLWCYLRVCTIPMSRNSR